MIGGVLGRIRAYARRRKMGLLPLIAGAAGGLVLLALLVRGCSGLDAEDRALLRKMRDESAAVRAAAVVDLLWRVPCAMPRVKEAQGPWPSPRRRDLRAAVPALVAALKDDSPLVRRGAARCLLRMGPDAWRAEPALRDAMSDRDPYVRLWSAGAVALFDPGDPRAKAVLAEGLPTLIRGLRLMPRGLAIEEAPEILLRMGPSAVPALARALEDSGDPFRYEGIGVLGLLGRQARPAVPALLAALKDPSPGVRRGAADSLGRIGGGGTLPALVAALGDPSDGVRYSAAHAVWRLDPGNRDALRTLVSIARDPRSFDRESALNVLATLRPSPPEALSALNDALRDESPQVRETAEHALEFLRTNP